MSKYKSRIAFAMKHMESDTEILNCVDKMIEDNPKEADIFLLQLGSLLIQKFIYQLKNQGDINA